MIIQLLFYSVKIVFNSLIVGNSIQSIDAVEIINAPIVNDIVIDETGHDIQLFDAQFDDTLDIDDDVQIHDQVVAFYSN